METYYFLEIALVLVCTKVFSLFTRRIHLPQVVGALLAGVLLGPALLGVVRHSELMKIMAEIGVILLMFDAGLDTNFEQLKKSLKASFVIAVLGVIVPIVGGFALAYAFGEGTIQSVFIGIILTATSVSITVETLQEMGKLQTRAGTAILGAAIIDDLLGIIMLTVLIRVGDGSGLTLAGSGLLLLGVLGFFIIALALGFVVYRILNFIDSKLGHTRRLSILALAFCFSLAFIAELFGIAAITGAYIAGIVLCNSKSASYIEPKINTLSYMFFSPMFFVSIGLMASFDGLNSRIVLFAVLLLLIAIASKIIGAGLGAKLCGFTAKESIQVGTGMVSRGEVALIMASKGITANLMNPDLFSSVIVVVIAVTLITPILLKFAFEGKKREIKV